MSHQLPHEFTVLIVGSGIAGLVLAQALAHAGIRSTVLEKRSHAVAIGGGASIGIFPNGARCLDELGVFDEVLRSAVPIQKAYLWSDGALLRRRVYPQTVSRRLGYPILFVRRHKLLEILYRNIPENLVQVIFEKEAILVEEMPEVARITCSDGSVLYGSIVVGADGIRSIVQSYISKHAKPPISLAEVSLNPPTEFSCLFGVSKFTDKVTKDTLHQSYNNGFSVTVVSSREETYWCAYLKNGSSGKASKFSCREPFDTLLQPILHWKFACNITLSELLGTATACYWFPLEERLCQKWCHGRLVSIGDSVHKMVPNLGQGGNMAIEDAMTLASSLADLLSISLRPTTAEMHQSLLKWQGNRFHRVEKAWHASHRLIRLETFSSTTDYIQARFIVPFLDSYIANQLCFLLQEDANHSAPLASNFHIRNIILFQDSIWSRWMFTILLALGACVYLAPKLWGL